LTVDNISSTVSVTGTITVYPLPEASFTYSPISGTAPLTVYFTSTSQYAGNPTWNFGDGGTGSGPNVNHTYNEPGTYTVTLTVQSPYGCGTATATHSIVVLPAVQRYFIYLPLLFKGY
ncbi:MAG: PKD domain-containing protein, partial [Chloroflexia bacterium]